LGQQARIMASRGFNKNLILCNTRAQQISFVRYFHKSKHPGIYVLVLSDYVNITRLLTETVMDDAIQTLQETVGPVEVLDPPEDGCRYKVNNEKTNIYSLIGYPIEQLFKLEKSLTMPGYIALADMPQYRQIVKHFPDYLAKYKPFVTKEYIHTPVVEIETPAEKERYRDWAAEIDMELI